MKKETHRALNSDEWTVIRDFTTDETGHTFPKYEAKYVPAVEKRYLESEMVLVKKTGPVGDAEQIFQFPKAVFEGVVDHLQ